MNKEAKLIKQVVEELFDEEVAFLQQLVQARSANMYTSDDSPLNVAVEEAVARVIDERLCQFGWQPIRHGLAPQSLNVLCTISFGARAGKVLILSTHMDTVPASDGCPRNPWGGEIEQNRIYGLGAADAKSQIAAFVYALRAVQMVGDKLLTGTVKLAFVVDEETGACSPYGTRYLLAHGLLDGDAALIGEPGDDKIALGHRGIYRFRITTQGEAIHTGLRAWEEGTRGHNAIHDMAYLILELEKCMFTFASSPLFPGRKPVLSFPTVIRGGNAVNIVAAGCEALGEVRLLPGMAENDVRQTLTTCLDQAHVAYHFEPLVFVPAASLSQDAMIVQVLSAAIQEVTGRSVRCAGAGPACDGWMFLSKGIPTVCGYGVACGGVHGADEWADLISLRQVTEVYARTIIDFFNAK